MKIKQFTMESGKDFYAILECEHCGHLQEMKHGYHDSYFHTKVIPGMVCKVCNRDRSMAIKPDPFADCPKLGPVALPCIGKVGDGGKVTWNRILKASEDNSRIAAGLEPLSEDDEPPVECTHELIEHGCCAGCGKVIDL